MRGYVRERVCMCARVYVWVLWKVLEKGEGGSWRDRFGSFVSEGFLERGVVEQGGAGG